MRRRHAAQQPPPSLVVVAILSAAAPPPPPTTTPPPPFSPPSCLASVLLATDTRSHTNRRRWKVAPTPAATMAEFGAIVFVYSLLPTLVDGPSLLLCVLRLICPRGAMG